jgi:hypothetical protein
LCGDTFPLAEEPKKEVLGSDVVMSEVERLAI